MSTLYYSIGAIYNKSVLNVNIISPCHLSDIVLVLKCAYLQIVWQVFAQDVRIRCNKYLLYNDKLLST